jgi:glutaredoxin
MLAAIQKLFRRGRQTPPLEVIFYSKPDCSLCDKAEAILRRLQRRYRMTVTKVNILEHADLRVAYRCKIPLIKIDGGNQVAVRITEERLRRALERAITRRIQSENKPPIAPITRMQEAKKSV